MENNNGRPGGLSSLRDEAASASSPKASIPDAPKVSLWRDQRFINFRVEFENGPVSISAPLILEPDDIADLESYLSIIFKGYHRRAKAIEARQGGGADAVHESAVAESDLPKGEQS